MFIATNGQALATDADIVNAFGFEAPFSTSFVGTGQLEGQVNPQGFGQPVSPGQWLRTQGSSANTAVVQSTVFAPGGGNQAVKVDRTGNADTRWAVPANSQGYPDYPNPAPPEPAQPFICISWDMRVEQTVSAAFGPYFAVEAYDDDANPVSTLGSFGVDASTRDVLFQAANTGFLTETGVKVNYGAWNKFAMELNYATHTYKFLLNGVVLGTQGFVDQLSVVGGLNEFSDADITTVAAAGDPISLALAGTAYYDNFVVREGQCSMVPEPATWVLGLLGLAGVANARRRRK